MSKCFHDSFCDCKDCCFSCKDKRDDKCDFVKDKVCCCFCIPAGATQPVYQVSGLNVFASGTVSLDCCDNCFITVTFLKDGNQVGSGIDVFPGSCLSFTAANFNAIAVKCNQAGGTTPPTCSGKICVTPRYQIKCDDEDGGCC